VREIGGTTFHVTYEDLSNIGFALEHFFHMDKANASIHTADVRFSPITFRLAETLFRCGVHGHVAANEVLKARGQYEEDKGR
jgi:hypothetical protein